MALGGDVTLDELRRDYDAVFLAMGLGRDNKLGLPGESDLENVVDAVDYIAELRQAEDLTALPVGRRVVVIGGGMTAIDIAVQSKRLGAENVTIVYRRGRGQMKASRFERELAQTTASSIRTWAQPVAIEGHAGALSGVLFEDTHEHEGVLASPAPCSASRPTCCSPPSASAGRRTALDGAAIELKGGRIVVDAERRTSLAGRLGRRRLRVRRRGPDGQRGRGRQAGRALDRRALGVAAA